MIAATKTRKALANHTGQLLHCSRCSSAATETGIIPESEQRIFEKNKSAGVTLLIVQYPWFLSGQLSCFVLAYICAVCTVYMQLCDTESVNVGIEKART